MKPFLDDNFLLETKTAETLYHEHAKKMPIIDFHNHLSAKEIAENQQFENLSQAWLKEDHYKWRAMRANGINEKFITGSTTDFEKFEKWAETVPFTLRNPLYHWTHLELQRYFGIQDLLNTQTAQSIYDQTANLFLGDEYRVHGLLKKMEVEVVCTTDDPIDSLEYHSACIDSCETKVLPTWRPDKALRVDHTNEYNHYLGQLEEVSDVNIRTFNDLLLALRKRQQHFADNGCQLSDHGVEEFVLVDYSDPEIDVIFAKVRLGNDLSIEEQIKFRSAMLYELGLMNHEKGWVQQFHIGPIRNNSSRLYNQLGYDAGTDSMGDLNYAASLAKFLDRLDSQDQLTKTILYNVNPRDNEMMATMMGNFQDGSIPGKIQYGSGWWFLDQKHGMENQLNTLSNQGLLSRFVGMLTDSRSFLSFPRHEYFRRILCNLLGNDIEKGLMPHDMELVGQMVENICYHNAKQYFKFNHKVIAH